jgi:hypothetical protein
MQYKVVRSFYEGNTLHEEGKPFTHGDEAYVQKCLADGNIVAADSGVPNGFPSHENSPAEPGAPASTPPLDPNAGDSTPSSQPPASPPVDPNPPISPPTTPPPGTSGTNPTQAQIEQDMRFANGSGTPPAAPSLQ